MSEQRPFLRGGRREKEFAQKPKDLQNLINDALYILWRSGIPILSLSPRRMERVAMAFLAVADVKQSHDWPQAKDRSSGRFLKTRDIIKYWNAHFGEHIADSSYDDIRRQDLAPSVFAGIIVQNLPMSARNDPQRAYALDPAWAAVIRAFGSPDWEQSVEQFLVGHETLTQKLAVERAITRIPIKLPTGQTYQFSPGAHNLLQKAIVEEFLPRYGFGAEILYLGDAANKSLVYVQDRLQSLNFFPLDHGELPDVVAYTEARNWLYLIEAVHSTGPMSPMRLLRLRQLTAECKAEIIFVTAFPNRATFRKHIQDIAWETEVWLADNPDHVIHFDGERFLGSYQKNPFQFGEE
jgi:type II restriction enzyme